MFRNEPEYQYRGECCAGTMAFTLPSEFWQTKPDDEYSNAPVEARIAAVWLAAAMLTAAEYQHHADGAKTLPRKRKI